MKVKFVPYQPHCFAFGGFELQMLGTLAAVQNRGVDISKLDFWERNDDFEIVHCWGLGIANLENVAWAKKSGKKVVVTALLPYNEFFIEKVRHFISSYIRRNYFLIQLAKSADAIVVVNDLQADICHNYYKVPKERIHIIPNVVNNNFFAPNIDASSKDIFWSKYALKDYVLTTGNVCVRKNQLALIKACINKNLNLVMIGKPFLGEPDYILEIENLIGTHKNILWIKGLPENSPDLISAYLNCLVFALPSYVESQPICLLEAAAVQKPLLIADRAYAHQSYYKNAYLVDPSSVDEIGEALLRIMEKPAQFIPPKNVIHNCQDDIVGEQYINVYKKIVNQFP